MTFPLFRRFIGGTSYFKVIDSAHWIELKLRPDSTYEKYIFEVKNFADQHHLSDIIACDSRYYEEVEADAFDAIIADLPE